MTQLHDKNTARDEALPVLSSVGDWGCFHAGKVTWPEVSGKQEANASNYHSAHSTDWASRRSSVSIQIVGTGFLPIRLSAYLDWPTRHAGKSRCQMVQENSISLNVASVYPYVWSRIGLLSGVPDFGSCLITDLFSITTQYSVSVSFILSCTLSNLHQSGHPSFPAQDVFSLSTFLLMS